MAYVPDWVPLSDALNLVMAAGLSETEAKLDLCHAMADGKIKFVFAALRAEAIESKQVIPFVGTRVNIPRDLRPGDLDWRKSCPTTPWQHHDYPWVQVYLARVELSSADVTLTLCGGRNSVEVSTEADQERAAEGRRRELKREMTVRLFAEPFWPASRALGWIGFRDPQLIDKSWTAAKLKVIRVE